MMLVNKEIIFKDIKAKHGDFKIITFDMYISRYLEKYGEWAEQECDLYKKMLNKQCIVVEVGSHIGSHTIPLANIASYVITYEPQRLIYQTLCHNLIKNNVTNVCAYMMAVGKENKDIQLNEIDYKFYINNNKETNTGGAEIKKLLSDTGYKIPMVTLDNHLHHLQSLHFLKIDAEFMELDILKGATQLINKFKPVLYFEFDLNVNKDLFEYVTSLDYIMYYHITEMFNPDNHNKDKEDLHPHSTSNMIFAVHKSLQFKTNLERVQC
jgi:FkbM family methyltransferase